MIAGIGTRGGRLFNLANNGITIAGFALTTVSGLLIVTFLIVNLFGGLHKNPYVGTFAFLVLPAFFVTGLVAMPVGMLIRRRRLLRIGSTQEELEAYPKLDFNSPQVRRFVTLVLGLTAVNAVILGRDLVSRRRAHGQRRLLRHDLPHGHAARVHRLPGLARTRGWPASSATSARARRGSCKAKVDGLRQVWHTTMNTYQPARSRRRSHTLRPARETCEQCHWPAKHHGDKLRVFARYAADEANTPSYTAMLLKHRRRQPRPRPPRRHPLVAHLLRQPDPLRRRRRAAAGDRLGRADDAGRRGPRLHPGGRGAARGRRDLEPRPGSWTASTATTGRPTSSSRRARPSTTSSSAARSCAKLPFFKREAVRAIQGDYPTHDDRRRRGARGRPRLLPERAPRGVGGPQPAWSSAGADAAAEVYGRTVFPEMKTNWETHPNHIGHEESPGCWRCHDDALATADGEHVIPQDCDTCHVFLVEDSPELPDLAALVNG